MGTSGGSLAGSGDFAVTGGSWRQALNPLHPFVAARAGSRCEYCHAPELVHNFTFEVEHIYPRSAGGADSDDNLALSCTSCNVFKSDAVAGWDAQELDQVPFFHPRHDHWEHHFVFDPETAQVARLVSLIIVLLRP